MEQQGRCNRGRGYGGRGQQGGRGVSGRGLGGGGGRDAPTVANSSWGCAATPDSLASDLARMGISPSPVQHPDRTNTTLWLSVSSLRLQFDPNMIVHHYDVDVRPESLPMAVKAELFRVYAAQFPLQVLAYDGHRSLLSPGLLPEGDFRAATQAGMLHVGLKLLKAVPLQELQLDAKHVVYF